MSLSNLLAMMGNCPKRERILTSLDVDKDGWKDDIGLKWWYCEGSGGDQYYFLRLSSIERGLAASAEVHLDVPTEENIEPNTNLVFKVPLRTDFGIAASLGSSLFKVGQDVRLLDGRAGRIESIRFVFDKNLNPIETRAEVVVDRLPYSLDVYLSELRPKWKPKAKE